MAAPPFEFYRDTYRGVNIPEPDWARIAMRADEQVAFFERAFTVTAPLPGGRNMAVCAIADQMSTYEAAVNAEFAAASNVSIGSVSTANKAVSADNLGLDLSEAGRRKTYYRIAQKYLGIYRGVCR